MTESFPTPEGFAARRPQMFPVLTDAQRTRAIAFGVEKTFAAGAIVFDQGDEDIPFYVVLEGQLEVVHPQGKLEDPITVHGPGEFTGEVNLLTNRRSLARGRAKGPLRVSRIEPARMRSLIQNDPELSEILMRAFILRRVGLLSSGYGDALILGSRDSAATLRVQEFLLRNGHPYRYVDVDRDPGVQALLDEFHVGVKDVPVLVCRGERVLRNPSNAEVADCLGFNPSLEPAVVHDVVICGAGPGGLAAAVYGASEGLDVLVVESGAPGGQAASSSKIENYLGFPTGISGQALGARALAQAEKFGARLLVARGALRLYCDEVPMRVELAGGQSVRTRAIIVASGAEYRKLDLPELARFEGVGIYYAATFVEAQRCTDEGVIVVGGGNSAGQAATFLSRSTKHVHMLIRGPDLGGQHVAVPHPAHRGDAQHHAPPPDVDRCARGSRAPREGDLAGRHERPAPDAPHSPRLLDGRREPEHRVAARMHLARLEGVRLHGPGADAGHADRERLAADPCALSVRDEPPARLRRGRRPREQRQTGRLRRGGGLGVHPARTQSADRVTARPSRDRAHVGVPPPR